MGNLINKPKLRFSEFTDSWIMKELGDLLAFKNGINASKEQYGSGIKFINVLDILKNDYITYDKIIGSVDVDEKILENFPVKYGDILFQRSSETREEVGTACVYLDKINIATFGGFVIRGEKVGIYDPMFLNLLLKTNAARDAITSKSGGSTRYNVGQGILTSISLFYPELIEQQRIGLVFSSINEKIQILKSKKSLLEQYKKGVMQQLFSQELRFKVDDGNIDGEDVLLGSLCKITTGKLDANAMNDNGKYRFYTCAKDYYRIDNYAFDTEALLISGNGANVGYIHYFKGKFNAYQRTYVLDGFKQNIQYVKFFLEHFLPTRILNEKKEGNTPYIVLSALSEMPILLPSLPEQQKIASFLTSLDEKIAQTAIQIEKMQLWKKGLLQQMFV
jgi:type I restriction enzyme S subunit